MKKSNYNEKRTVENNKRCAIHKVSYIRWNSM